MRYLAPTSSFRNVALVLLVNTDNDDDNDDDDVWLLSKDRPASTLTHRASYLTTWLPPPAGAKLSHVTRTKSAPMSVTCTFVTRAAVTSQNDRSNYRPHKGLVCWLARHHQFVTEYINFTVRCIKIGQFHVFNLDPYHGSNLLQQVRRMKEDNWRREQGNGETQNKTRSRWQSW